MLHGFSVSVIVFMWLFFGLFIVFFLPMNEIRVVDNFMYGAGFLNLGNIDRFSCRGDFYGENCLVHEPAHATGPFFLPYLWESLPGTTSLC